MKIRQKKRNWMKRPSAVLLSAMLVTSSFPGVLGQKALAATPSFDGLGHTITYEQGDSPIIAPNFELKETGSYADGYLKFALRDGTTSENLRLKDTAATADTTNLEVSVVDSKVYLGDGTTAQQIGAVNKPSNGQAGKALQIDFSKTLTNGDFETPANGDVIEGWTINSGTVQAGGDRPQIWLGELASKTIGGDIQVAAGSSGTYIVSGTDINDQPYTYETDQDYSKLLVVNEKFVKLREGVETSVKQGIDGEFTQFKGIVQEANRGGVLELGFINGEANAHPDEFPIVPPGKYGGCGNHGTAASDCNFATVFGPDAVSDQFDAKSGDKIAFEWKSDGALDDYEVYGFLYNVDTQDYTEIMYGRGKSQPWTTFGGEIPADGTYQFRFVAGSYDATGGTALGAKLLIDNVRILSSSITSDVLDAVAKLVTYENTPVIEAKERVIQVTAKNADGTIFGNQGDFVKIELKKPAQPGLFAGPGGVKDNLKLWLKADDAVFADGENDKIKNWTDQAGLNKFINLTSGYPVYNPADANFNPTVGFSNSGSSPLMPTVDSAAYQIIDAFAVVKNGLIGTIAAPTGKSGSQPNSIFEGGIDSQLGGGNNKYLRTGVGASMTPIFLSTASTTAGKGWMNGVRYSGFQNAQTPPNSQLLIGGRNDKTRPLGGDFAELVIFGDEITDTERQQVQSYLSLKYGITLRADDGTSTDYIASDGSMKIWTADDNTDYGEHITGLGRDDDGALNHKQSKSQLDDANVTIVLGDTIAETNKSNNSTIANDKSFFVFSDNGKATTFVTPLAKGIESLRHLERIYKVEKTNWQDTNVTLEVDKVANTTWPQYLVVSSDATFDAQDTFYALTDGKVTIGSDKFANGAYFTFAAPAPQLESATLKETQANGNEITLTFDKEVKFDGDAKNGFTITVDGQEITLDNNAFKVDPTDSEKVIITLPTGTDVTDKKVEVSYDGTGNLKGTNGVPVNEFEVTAEDSFSAALTITKPDAQVTVSKPEMTGKAEAGSEVKVVIKDKEGNEITDAGGTATVDGNGNWTFTPGIDLTDGDYTVEVTATKDDKTATKTKDFTINTKQYVDYTKVTDVTDINPNGVTYDKTSGKFTVPSDVDKFTFKDGDKEMTATKGADGNWAMTEADPSVIVIITEPEANTIKTAKPTFKGTATPGSTVKVKVSDTLMLETTADANGNWSVTPNADLPDGEYNIEVTATKDGKTSPKDTKDLTISTVDKSQLEARADMSTGLTEGNYTSDSWTTYKNALDAAKNVLNNPNATQQQVNDAYNALKDAQDALASKDSTAGVDKSKLQAKADDSAQFTEGDYTPDSWKSYKTALDTANNVLNDANATQKEVNQALEDLTGAQNALNKKGGLNGLTPSTGTLSPSFSNDIYNYSMNVGNSTSEIDFSYGLFDENATVTMTSNGVKVTDGKAPLKVGQNTIVIKVEDATGTKTYTITVNRANPSTGGGGGGSGGGVTPPTGPTTETIIVDLEVDGDQPVEKTPVEITRTTETDGTVSDRVELTLKHAQLAVDKALEIGNDTARIVLPDVKDEVDRATVEIPAQSVKLLKENGIDLEIYSNDALITLPQTSMEGIEGDFYFRLVPVKKISEQQVIEERAKLEEVVQAFMGSEDILIVARPMTIETNLSSRPVLVTLPLRDVKVPEGEAERATFLKRLGVYIEHSDGEKEVVFGKVVEMPKGELGLQISVTKFSTFTIINFGEKEAEINTHNAYIKGFPDGTFKAEQHVTRNQIALMIARNLGYADGEKVTTAPFNDVPVNSEEAGAITYLKELGIMNGDEKGNFRGYEQITRAHMAVVIANYKKLNVEERPVSFTDTKNHWAKLAIEANRDAGIITGYEDGTFKPNNNLTRAQAVKMINRMFDRGPLYGTTAITFSDIETTHWAFEEIVEAATTHTYTVDTDEKEWITK